MLLCLLTFVFGLFRLLSGVALNANNVHSLVFTRNGAKEPPPSPDILFDNNRETKLSLGISTWSLQIKLKMEHTMDNIYAIITKNEDFCTMTNAKIAIDNVEYDAVVALEGSKYYKVSMPNNILPLSGASVTFSSELDAVCGEFGGYDLTDVAINIPTPVKCFGGILWGDPHYLPWDLSQQQYNFQGLGDYYVMYPCKDPNSATNGRYSLPFTLFVKQVRCWHKGKPRGCADTATLVINPGSNNQQSITVGGGVYSSSVFQVNGQSVANQIPLLNQPFSGTFNGRYDIKQVREKGSDKKQVTVYIDSPALACKPALKFKMHRTWLYIDCPTCFLGQLCGILGFYNGQPTQDFVKSDGSKLSVSQSNFQIFAQSWKKDYVDSVTKSHSLRLLRKTAKNAKVQAEYAFSEYPYPCNNSGQLLNKVTTACWQARQPFYSCCQQIGICDRLTEGCKYDSCACASALNETDPNAAVAECVNSVVNFPDILNATCTTPELFPSNPPTMNPTNGSIAGPSPNGPQNKDDSDDDDDSQLLWLLLLLLLIPFGICIFCFYKKYYQKSVDFDQQTNVNQNNETQKNVNVEKDSDDDNNDDNNDNDKNTTTASPLSQQQSPQSTTTFVQQNQNHQKPTNVQLNTITFG